MSTEPLIFPNLVTGFERNPQHAARAALYTRYTNDEWSLNLKSKCDASDATRYVVKVLILFIKLKKFGKLRAYKKLFKTLNNKNWGFIFEHFSRNDSVFNYKNV